MTKYTSNIESIPNNQRQYFTGYKPIRLTDRIKAMQENELIKIRLHALYLKQAIDHAMEDNN
jgi:hypothetical protein